MASMSTAAFITVAFSLPSGSYATMFLRELMKSEELEATAVAEDAAPLPPEEAGEGSNAEKTLFENRTSS